MLYSFLKNWPHTSSYRRTELRKTKREEREVAVEGFIVYKEYRYQSVYPFVGIGPPTLSSAIKRVCFPYLYLKGGGNTRLRVRVWGTKFGRLYRKPGTLYNLWKPLAGGGGRGGGVTIANRRVFLTSLFRACVCRLFSTFKNFSACFFYLFGTIRISGLVPLNYGSGFCSFL